MPFVILCITLEGSSSPIKDWFGCEVTADITLSELYTEFYTGKFDGESVVDDRSTLPTVYASERKPGKGDDMIKVSAQTKLSNIVSTIGSFIKFVQTPIKLPEIMMPQNTRPSAFAVLMAGASNWNKSLPPKFNDSTYHPAKSRLKNDIRDWLEAKSVGWSPDTSTTLGVCFINRLADTMWYIDRNHDTMKARGCHIPAMFSQFSGFRCPEKQKKRKIDATFLEQDQLREYSTALFDLCMSSYMKKEQWSAIRAGILSLAESLAKYATYLSSHLKRVKEDSARLNFANHAENDHFKVLQRSAYMKPTIAARYRKINDDLMKAHESEPLYVNDYAPVDHRRRHEFISELKVPCKAVLYTHSGSGPTHAHFLWKTSEFHTQEELMNEASRISKDISKDLAKYHTRAMRREFIHSFGQVTTCKAAFLREAYRRLTGDCSASDSAKQADVDKRITQILDEEDPGLMWDLRGNNTGRPKEYEVFLQQCKTYINTSVETAVDERRHDEVDEEVITHLATALSVRDLHEEVSKNCPEGTPIPSIQWLRTQFWPRKPNAKTASRYTGQLKVKFMVQARQFRMNHVDAHYASALFRYEKEFAIKFRDHASFMSMDDKHTIKIGEPGFPVAAAERGKSVLVAMGKKFAVADHDFTRLSLSPSVTLAIDVPETIDGSFYRGKVCVILKENAFQPSSPIRHITELKQFLTRLGPVKPIVLLYTDGGPDHRLTYLSVQLSLLALFIEFDLDYLCAVRTPPQHSWKNPVERIMSILNLGLQGVGCMRDVVEHEEELKRCGSLKSIRELGEQIPELKEEVIASVKPTTELLSTMIRRLKLKDHHFETDEAAPEDDIATLWENVLKIDDSLTREDRTKQHIKNKHKLIAFLDNHCKVRQYMFSVLKCRESSCNVCKTPQLPPDIFQELAHLPDPVPQGSRYKSFDELYGKVETTEDHLPSRTLAVDKGHKCPFNPTAQTARNVGVVIQCHDCGKWRCLHSKKKLKGDKREELEILLEMLLYSCGSVFDDIDTDDEQSSVIRDVHVRANISCHTNIEFTYYSAGYENICIYCGEIDDLLDKDGFYPQCQACINKDGIAKRGRKFNVTSV